MSDAATNNWNNNYFSSDSKTNDGEGSEPDINTSIPLNKIIKCIKDFYDTCIKSKYIRIIKYKTMTLII